WPAEKFRDLIESLPGQAVVLGRPHDRNSQKLVELLKASDLDHLSGIGSFDLLQTAQVLAGARFLVTVDTGLAHLGQALGTPTLVVFGPTVPDMGFGPWAAESRSV